MSEMSHNFTGNRFDKLDALISEVIDENEVAMSAIRRPGQIGAVAISYQDPIALLET